MIMMTSELAYIPDCCCSYDEIDIYRAIQSHIGIEYETHLINVDLLENDKFKYNCVVTFRISDYGIRVYDGTKVFIPLKIRDRITSLSCSTNLKYIKSVLNEEKTEIKFTINLYDILYKLFGVSKYVYYIRSLNLDISPMVLLEKIISPTEEERAKFIENLKNKIGFLNNSKLMYTRGLIKFEPDNKVYSRDYNVVFKVYKDVVINEMKTRNI